MSKSFNCPTCQNLVSSSARKCPKCGHKLKSYGFGIILILIIAACSFYVLTLDTAPIKNNTSYTSPKAEVKTYRVEDIDFNTDNSVAWGITGKIRNLTSHAIKGYVTIKLIDKNGDITQSYKAYVNDGDPFEPNQAAEFDYFTEPKHLKDLGDVKVTFIEK